MEFVYNPSEYVNQSGSQYGAPKTVNKLLYNWNRGTDWKDSTAFAYQRMAQREENAYATALMNYMNEYNSPLEQMKRYQAAGYNPMDALGKTNLSATPNSASGGSASAHKTQAQAARLNSLNSVVSNINSIVQGVADTKRAYQEMRYYDEAYPQMIADLKNKAEISATNAEYQPYFNEKRNQLYMWNLADAGMKGVEYAMDMGLSLGDMARIYSYTLNPLVSYDEDHYDALRGQYANSYSWKNKIAGMNLRQRQYEMMKKRYEFEREKFNKSISWRAFEDLEKKRHNKVMEDLFGKGLWVKGGASILNGLFKMM